MGKLIDVDKFLERVKKDREHEIYLHSWTADMVLERLDSWYAPAVEAIPKDQYEARLKADLEAILDEIDLALAEQQANFIGADNLNESYGVQVSRNVIREKINALKADSEVKDADSN